MPKEVPGDLVVLADGSLVRAAHSPKQQFSARAKEPLQQPASGTHMGDLIYAGWVYKKDGGPSSCYGGVAAYSRRYFVVTASGCLEYYKSKEKSAQMLPPRNTLVCVGMQVISNRSLDPGFRYSRADLDPALAKLTFE